MNRMKMKTEILPAEGEAIAKAADLLRRGELVALPTETVYGIAADARNGAAVAKIFVAKGRPQDNPLIVHVTGPEMLPGLVSEVPECPAADGCVLPRPSDHHHAPRPGGGRGVLCRSGHGGHPDAQPPGGTGCHCAERLCLCSPQREPFRQA